MGIQRQDAPRPPPPTAIQVQELAEQLGGGNVKAPFPFDGHFIPRFPEAEWKEPGGTHLDAYGPNGWTGGFNHGFGTVAYLSDINDQGGGFTYWPGAAPHHPSIISQRRPVVESRHPEP